MPLHIRAVLQKVHNYNIRPRPASIKKSTFSHKIIAGLDLQPRYEVTLGYELAQNVCFDQFGGGAPPATR